MKKIRIGIIGCGGIARKAHIPAIRSLAPMGVDVVAVADTDLEVVRKVSNKFRIEKYYNDYRAMLEDAKIDIASVCAPTPLHAQIALDAIKAGKHVLVEKPLATTTSDAKTIIEAAKNNAVSLCVAHNYRYYSSLKKTKNIVASGSIGRVIAIQGTAHIRIPAAFTSGRWPYQYGGTIYDFGPHLVDTAIWLASSEPKQVVAFGGDVIGTMGIINSVQAVVEFENSTSAALSISWLMGKNEFNVRVCGTGGVVAVEVFPDKFVEMHGDYSPLSETANFLEYMFHLGSNIVRRRLLTQIPYFADLYADFVRSLSEGTSPPITGEEGMSVVRVLEAITESVRRQRLVQTDLGACFR